VRSLRLRLSYLVIAAFAAFASALAAADSVRVFAAASLKEAMDEQGMQFERATGNKTIVSYGASNALVKQIAAGAPADVFVSADVDWMDYLSERGLVVRDTRVDLLRNSLVLIAPSSSDSTLRIAPNFGLAAALGTQRLAMANPDSVPAGRYARSALEKLGVWPSVEGKLARSENVRAALTLVSRGEAPFGIVYRTDALADKRVRIVDEFPAASHPPIIYPAALVAGSKSGAARELLDYLHSAAARAVWQRFGFGVTH